MADGHVVKRFRTWDRGEPEREWRALNVLAEFAPGLAPAQLSADLDAASPTIMMSGSCRSMCRSSAPTIMMTLLPGDPQPAVRLALNASSACWIHTRGGDARRDAGFNRRGCR